MWLSIAHKPGDWRYADSLFSEDQVDGKNLPIGRNTWKEDFLSEYAKDLREIYVPCIDQNCIMT